MSDRPNINAALQTLCDKLDLDLNSVRRLEITPTHVYATTYVRNEHGRITIHDGNVVTVESTFEVRI
jgi:uncharacterized protein (UPF0179 family)